MAKRRKRSPASDDSDAKHEPERPAGKRRDRHADDFDDDDDEISFGDEEDDSDEAAEDDEDDEDGTDDDIGVVRPCRKPPDGVKDSSASAKPRDFFQSIGEGLKAASKTAEKYARMGISAAALEKMKLDLRSAYARLGEAVHRCWNDAPDLGVAASDPSVRAQVKAVNDLRRKIRETEIKLRELKKQ